jgi:hypothetical protein
MMRRIAVIALTCLCGAAAWAFPPPYPWSCAWVEEHSTTNDVPKNERLFVGIQTPSTGRGQIDRYQSGLSLRTIIGESVFSNSDVYVLILRAGQSEGQIGQVVFDGVVKPNEKPAVALKPLDMIWLTDPGMPQQ